MDLTWTYKIIFKQGIKRIYLYMDHIWTIYGPYMECKRFDMDYIYNHI